MLTGRWMRCTAIAFVALTFAPAESSAQSIDEAREAYFRVELEEAGAMFDGIVSSSDASVDELVDAHRFLSAIRFLTGDAAAARESAAAAVALEPAASPPEGTPPELAALFDELRGEGASLEIEGDAPPLGESRPVVLRLLEGDALRAQLTLWCEGAGADGTASGRQRELSLSLSPTEAGPVRCRGRANAPSGALLLEARRDFEIGGPRGGAAVAEVPSDDSALGWGLGLGIAAVVALGVTLGLVFGLPRETNTLGAPEVDAWGLASRL